MEKNNLINSETFFEVNDKKSVLKTKFKSHEDLRNIKLLDEEFWNRYDDFDISMNDTIS